MDCDCVYFRSRFTLFEVWTLDRAGTRGYNKFVISAPMSRFLFPCDSRPQQSYRSSPFGTTRKWGKKLKIGFSHRRISVAVVALTHVCDVLPRNWITKSKPKRFKARTAADRDFHCWNIRSDGSFYVVIWHIASLISVMNLAIAKL